MKKVYQELLENIPDYKEFLTVDEMDASSKALAEKYPDVVSIAEIGRTRENHPLYCLKIGEGKQNALVFGLPHPNEPIGTMLMEYFTRALAENAELRRELDYTWYIVKAWDADGTKLNEGWMKGPYTISNYVRNFYRPAGFEQVDWTWPIDYKELHFHNSIPETIAMMKLIDEIQPRFIYSLHNAGFGGVYWYMSGESRGIFEDFHKVPAKWNVPMHLGEPESPSCVEMAPAIYHSLGIASEYDYIETYGNVDMKEFVKTFNTGDCSASYAREKYHSFTLLTELPYFYDARIEDLSPSDITRKAAILQKTEAGLKNSQSILDSMAISQDYFSPDNHFMLAIKAFNENQEDNAAAVRAMVESDPQYDKLATVAEKFDNLLVSQFYQSLSAGMLARANQVELDKMADTGEINPEKKAALERGLESATKAREEILSFLEKEMDYQAVPIRNLVGIQLECGLMMAEYLKEHPEA